MTDRHSALAAVNALAHLLRQEIAAIESGAFADLVQFSGEKARLTAQLEKQLQDNPQAVSKDSLQALRELIARDSLFLEHAQRATADVIQEVSNIRRRHSTAGVYGRDGATRDKNTIARPTVDQTL